MLARDIHWTSSSLFVTSATLNQSIALLLLAQLGLPLSICVFQSSPSGVGKGNGVTISKLPLQDVHGGFSLADRGLITQVEKDVRLETLLVAIAIGLFIQSLDGVIPNPPWPLVCRGAGQKAY